MKRFFMCAVILVAVALSMPAFAKTVLKLGHIAEVSHPYAQGADYFAKLVGEKSGGDMEVQVSRPRSSAARRT
jgi:TRAP-type C4-dicarboxylate transport system, periplasmic component